MDRNAPVAATALATLVTAPCAAQSQNAAISLDPRTMKRIGTVDERYQSYNVEMLEVTGGRFWKPYKDIAPAASGSSATQDGGDTGVVPAGMSPDLYQYRAPIDLANSRLRAMARALGPTYVRISGTWANTTYFAEIFKNRDLLILALAGFCSLWGTYGFITWSNTLMIKGANTDPVSAGLVVTLFAITALFGKPLVRFVAARANFHPKYIATAILGSFSVMLVVFGQLHTFYAFLVAAPLLGFTAYCYSPIQNALILDYAGRSLSGSAAGALNASWQLGSVIVPTVVGVVFASTGSVYAAFLTLAAGPLSAALLMLPLSSRFKDQM